jgi:hypothetical protein
VAGLTWSPSSQRTREEEGGRRNPEGAQAQVLPIWLVTPQGLADTGKPRKAVWVVAGRRALACSALWPTLSLRSRELGQVLYHWSLTPHQTYRQFLLFKM